MFLKSVIVGATQFSAILLQIISRKELPLTTSRTALFLQNPRACTLFMVQMLAFELNNLFLVLDADLTDGTMLGLLFIMVDGFFPASIDLIERNVFFFLFDLVKDSSVTLKPFLCRILTHDIKWGKCAHRGRAGYMTAPAKSRILGIVGLVWCKLKATLARHLEQRSSVL